MNPDQCDAFKPKSLWLITVGSGEDGDDWYILSIWTHKHLAEAALEKYQNGAWHRDTRIEEWKTNGDPVNKVTLETIGAT